MLGKAARGVEHKAAWKGKSQTTQFSNSATTGRFDGGGFFEVITSLKERGCCWLCPKLNCLGRASNPTEYNIKTLTNYKRDKQAKYRFMFPEDTLTVQGILGTTNRLVFPIDKPFLRNTDRWSSDGRHCSIG